MDAVVINLILAFTCLVLGVLGSDWSSGRPRPRRRDGEWGYLEGKWLAGHLMLYVAPVFLIWIVVDLVRMAV